MLERLVIAVSVPCLALWIGCASSLNTSDPRTIVDKHRPNWLPATAQMVFSSQWEDGFLGDGSLKIKARVTEPEFKLVVKQLELTSYGQVPQSSYGDEPPQWLGDSDKRWDVSADLDDTFIQKRGRWWQLAKFQNGFLYYQSVTY